ncbi:MAG: Gfo/Idh/MocA family oxidoreductase [Verrucomicrobiales bacterium]|nr:Gfo/Idh/MocA family oxidoreductase [Verrucomicrobiales bacterium]
MSETSLSSRTSLAFVGCGYVADFYALTLRHHPDLLLEGAFDIDGDRLDSFTRAYDVRAYDSLDELLSDENVSIVVNLTTPQSHFEVSRSALLSGKHVYSEKPLSTNFSESLQLAEIAAEQGLHLSAAPCTVLGEVAQTVWKELRKEYIGPVRLVFAEMNDGLVHQLGVEDWRSCSGAPWPYRNEFITGCTNEHAGYWLTWLVAFFGPAIEVSSFATNIVEDPIDSLSAGELAPDFSVACIRFRSGVVARITCSIVASRNRELRIFGDNAELVVPDAWDFGAKASIRNRPEKSHDQSRYLPIPLLKPPPEKPSEMVNNIDFCRGIAELSESIAELRPCRLSSDFAVHVDELCHLITSSRKGGSKQQLTSTCEPMVPMDWAK